MLRGRNARAARDAGQGSPRPQRLLVLIVLAAVILLDQAAKWWAWRHVPTAEINPGGDFLVGHAVGEWYDAPVSGALLDLVDFVLLSAALTVLIRRRRPAAVVVSAALMLGGWSSNLLDRLGLHYWTAPGSVRGAVDFIRIGGAKYNVADFFIIGATPLFLVTVGHLGVRSVKRRRAVRAAAPAAPARRLHPRPRAWRAALVGAGLIVVPVVLGAANYGGVSTGPAQVSASYAPGRERASESPFVLVPR